MKENIKGQPVLFSKMRGSSALIIFLFSLALPLACCAGTPKKICFKDTCVELEIADTDDSRARGLMFRKELPANSGMLFIFPQDGIYSFWMKNTLLPLDMIWLDNDLRVVDIKSFVPVCRSYDCPSYTPVSQARYVLEVNAGFTAFNRINLNDKAVLKNE